MQKLLNFSEKTGLTLLIPIIKMIMKDEPQKQLGELTKLIVLPSIALIIFFGLWGFAATRISTSVGALPSPAYVWAQAKAMAADARAEKVNRAEFAHYEKSRATLSGLLTERTQREATGKPTIAVDARRADFAAKEGAYLSKLETRIKILSDDVAEAHTKAEAAGITNRRVAPYKTNVLKVYTDSQHMSGIFARLLQPSR